MFSLLVSVRASLVLYDRIDSNTTLEAWWERVWAYSWDVKEPKGFQVRLSKQQRQELWRLLRSGLQPGRTVLRALALRQLAEGQVIRKVAANIGLTPKTVWLTSQRYQQVGLERASCERPRPGKRCCWIGSNGGAGGFIGHHLVKRLKSDGHWVRVVDITYPECEATAGDAYDDFPANGNNSLNLLSHPKVHFTACPPPCTPLQKVSP